VCVWQATISTQSNGGNEYRLCENSESENLVEIYR